MRREEAILTPALELLDQLDDFIDRLQRSRRVNVAILVHLSLQVSHLGDLYAESGQTLQGSFSAVSKPNFASKY